MLFLAFPALILAVSGESFRSLDRLAREGDNDLIGYDIDEDNLLALKQHSLEIRKVHTVVALGSSRVLQFRKEMFNSRFYNAGYTVSDFQDYEAFLRTLPKDKLPSTLLISLDQWTFNASKTFARTPPPESRWENFDYFPSDEKLLQVTNYLIDGRYTLERINKYRFSDSIIGLQAINYGMGLRDDGSMDYGAHTKALIADDTTLSDYGFRDTFKRITAGTSNFEPGAQVRQESLLQLKGLLAFCKQRDIHVVAFIPPFANKVQAKLKQIGRHTYMDKIFGYCKPLFSRYNFECYDLSRLSTFKSEDSEMLDGFHGSEVAYGRMLLHLSQSSKILRATVNVKSLREKISARKNGYQLYAE
ncbi:MAG: hypothetical protein EOO03_15225 [Chitinophagaceae bacterium]|nr:MAG: hypothetical protein EOO03_15225 [Chitinophagaceae bacterium]